MLHGSTPSTSVGIPVSTGSVVVGGVEVVGLATVVVVGAAVVVVGGTVVVGALLVVVGEVLVVVLGTGVKGLVVVVLGTGVKGLVVVVVGFGWLVGVISVLHAGSISTPSRKITRSNRLVNPVICRGISNSPFLADK